jgi:AcrR family transcriptional regulator
MGIVTDETGLLATLWEPRPAPRRGPKPAMSIEKIAEAAVRIADEEGFEAVALQRVAAELGFTKMSLYRYVDGRDGLVAVMVEAAVDVPPSFAAGTPWRERVRTFADALLVTWRDHPWLPWVTIGDRSMGPREVAWIECSLAAFDDTPLTERERLDASYVLFGLLRNAQSVSRAGTQLWTADQQLRPVVATALGTRPGDFPQLARAADAIAREPTPDNGLAFGVERFLDGIEVLIDSRRKKRKRS